MLDIPKAFKNIILATIAVSPFLSVGASEFVIVYASDKKIEVNGRKVESIDEFEKMIGEADLDRALIHVHVCLDTKTLIRIMGVFSNYNYIQTSLSAYGKSGDFEC